MPEAPAPSGPSKAISTAVDMEHGTVIVRITDKPAEGDTQVNMLDIHLTPDQSKILRHRLEQAERMFEDVGTEPGLKG